VYEFWHLAIFFKCDTIAWYDFSERWSNRMLTLQKAKRIAILFISNANSPGLGGAFTFRDCSHIRCCASTTLEMTIVAQQRAAYV